MILQGFGGGNLLLWGLGLWEEIVEAIGGAISRMLRPHIPRQIDFVPTQKGISFMPTSRNVKFVTRRK